MAELSSLDSLEQGELEVLWRRLKGQLQVVICREMGIADATYYRYQASAYYKLGIDQNLSRKLKWLQFEREWRETIGPMTEEEVKNWKPKVEVNVPEIEEPVEQEAAAIPVKNLNWLVWVGVLVLAFILLFSYNRLRNTAEITLEVPTPVSTPEQPSTATAAAPSATVEVAPPVLPSETSTIAPTLAPTITDTVVANSATSENILFSDDFTTPGLGSDWQLEKGNANVYDGKLRTADSALLSIGSVEWTDYEVTFTITEPYCYYYSHYVGVRALDSGNMAALHFCVREVFWAEFNDGLLNLGPSTFTKHGIDQTTIEIRIRVKGNEFQAFDYPAYVPEPPDKFPKGRIYVFFQAPATIDDFKVVHLP